MEGGCARQPLAPESSRIPETLVRTPGQHGQTHPAPGRGRRAAGTAVPLRASQQCHRQQTGLQAETQARSSSSRSVQNKCDVASHRDTRDSLHRGERVPTMSQYDELQPSVLPRGWGWG